MASDATRCFPVPYTEDQVRNIFRACGKNWRDGRLSKLEVEKAFIRLGSHAPGWRAFWAMVRADHNKDGYVASEAEFEELVKYAFKRGYMIPCKCK